VSTFMEDNNAKGKLSGYIEELELEVSIIKLLMAALNKVLSYITKH
jgi:hypothetical protein